MNIHITYPNITANAQHLQIESLQMDNVRQATQRKVPSVNEVTPEPAIETDKDSLRQKQTLIHTPPARGEQDAAKVHVDDLPVKQEFGGQEQESGGQEQESTNSQEREEPPTNHQRSFTEKHTDPSTQEGEDHYQAQQEQRALELAQIRNFKKRDLEVRNHESAHLAAGGRLAGSVTYDYITGPNGVSYAVGGEVSIDVSPVPGDLEATIKKMQRVRLAALAPAQPSAQDIRVAQQASAIERQARQELLAKKQEQIASALEEAGRLIQTPNIPSLFNPLALALPQQIYLAPEIDQRAQRIDEFYQNISRVKQNPALMTTA